MSYAVVSDIDPIELHKVRPPVGDDWHDIPSASYKDIEVELYLRISRLQFTIIEHLYPYSTITQTELPLLRYDVDVIPYQHSIKWLQNNICDLNTHRGVDELSEIAAFTSLIHDKLIPATDYLEYCVDDNYYTVTRNTYAQHTAWPVNRYLCHRKRKFIQRQSADKGINSVDDAKQLIESAYTALHTRLAGRAQFYPGKLPSTLDILLCSVITIHRHAPYPINPAKEFLSKRKALLKFNDYIMTTYWPTRKTSGAENVLSPVKSMPVDEQLVHEKPPVKRSLAVQIATTETTDTTNTDEDAETKKVKFHNTIIFFGVVSAFFGYTTYQRNAAQNDVKPEPATAAQKI